MSTSNGVYQVLYLERLTEIVRVMIEEHVPRGFSLASLSEGSEAEIERRIGDADFVMVATTRIGAKLLARAPRLKLIQHQGVGFDNLDLAAIRAARIPVAMAPLGFSAVAEHAILLMLATLRKLVVADRGIREGRWLQWDLRPRSHELGEKTVGILGAGRIGKQVARMLAGFDVQVLYYDAVRLPEAEERALGISYADLPTLVEASDVVSVHLPLTPGTKGLLGEAMLRRMKPGAVLVNASRGGIVDEAALIGLLKSGHLGGAGLDVFQREPLPVDHELGKLDNVVLTPHVAAGTQETFSAKMRLAFTNMQRVLRGERPLHELVVPDEATT